MAKRPIAPDDRNRFLSPGDPQVSPDGSCVAFVVQRTDTKEDRRLTDIWMAPTSGSAPRQLTNSGKDRSPRWAPDSRTLAFVSSRDRKSQTWLIDTSGGEAWCLQTEQPVDSDPAWSPDGKRIAFTSRIFSQDAGWQPYAGAPGWDRKRAEEQAAMQMKGPQAEPGDKKDSDKKDKDAKVSDIKVISRLRNKMDGVGFYGDRRSHVFVVDVPTERPAKPAKAQQVTSGDYDHTGSCWSSCGKYIAFVATRRPDADWLMKTDIWCAEVETGKMTQLLDASGQSGAPAWSPDGKTIVYNGHGGKFGSSTTTELRAFPVKFDAPATEKDVTILQQDLQRGPNAAPSSDVRYAPMLVPPLWSGDYIYSIVGIDGDTFVYRCRPGGPAELVAGQRDRVIAGMSAEKGIVAYQSGSAVEPEQIYCLGPDGTRQLTHFNQALLDELALGECERIRYKGHDGWDIDGWLIKPYGYEDGKKYPLVLHVHGGPHGVYGSTMQFQDHLLASNGIAVLMTNPRGSGAYGQAFQYAVVKDWGGNDFKDLMAGVDHAISRGIADPDRLGVTGWSYGGFMTCWTVTQTQRFKAAITGACVSNRHSFYGTSDIGWHFAEHHTGGSPWYESEKLLERSSVQFADKVTTPVLILHGEADLRCPLGQSEEFFTALKRQGKEAVLVTYPGEYHGFTKPSHWTDRYARVLSWFEHYLK